MATFLDDLLMAAQVVEVPAAMTEDGLSKDIDDNAVIALAVAGDADVLCTLDRHLKTEAVISYLGSMGIEVMSDIELLRRVRS